MGAIMEFATEKQIESFLSTCHIEGQKNFLMAFKKNDGFEGSCRFFYRMIAKLEEKCLHFFLVNWIYDIMNIIKSYEKLPNVD